MKHDEETFESVYVIFDSVSKVVVSELVCCNVPNFMLFGFKQFIDQLKNEDLRKHNYKLYKIGRFSRRSMMMYSDKKELICSGDEVEDLVDKLNDEA